MLKVITQLSMFLVGTLAQSQVSESRDVGHFTKIVSKGQIELIIAQAGQTELTAQANTPESLENIATEVRNNALYVYPKNGTPEKAKVYISASELSSLEISEGARVTLATEFNMPELSVSVSGKSIFSGNVNAAKLDISIAAGSIFNGSITAKDFSAKLSKNATARLSGWAENSRIKAESGSKCFARTLYSGKGHLSAQNRSFISANVEQKVKAEVSADSEIRWAGFPDSIELPADVQITKSNAIAFSGN